MVMILARAKGRAFLIIQVPFKIPVGSYDISLYVKKCFEDIGLEVEEKTLPLNLEEKFGVEFAFKSNIENNELIVDFNIYHIEDTTVDEIKEVVDSELVSLKEISKIEPEFSDIEIHFGNIFSKNYEEIEENEIYEEIKKYYDIMKYYFKKYNK
ncbi:hypothetical protein PKF05_04620 [Fusobacterium simiae]|uniref:hypothetical protein n=1 Tax=Fusobacterium TaxID=848 RepID=UPI00040E23A1|nr:MULTISPECIES: hypothetical protein [Fusobacterium]MDC7955119.1 hypothetical protein [Fusobacterium simiae]